MNLNKSTTKLHLTIIKDKEDLLRLSKILPEDQKEVHIGIDLGVTGSLPTTKIFEEYIKFSMALKNGFKSLETAGRTIHLHVLHPFK